MQFALTKINHLRTQPHGLQQPRGSEHAWNQPATNSVQPTCDRLLLSVLQTTQLTTLRILAGICPSPNQLRRNQHQLRRRTINHRRSAATSNPSPTTTKLAPPQTAIAEPGIKPKHRLSAHCTYVALLRLLITTVAYLYSRVQLRSRPNLHQLSAQNATPCGYDGSQTFNRTNMAVRQTAKTLPNNHCRNETSHYDAPCDLRQRTQSHRVTLHQSCQYDMSQYRAYFVPNGVDPMGLHKLTFDECTCNQRQVADIEAAWTKAIAAVEAAIADIESIIGVVAQDREASLVKIRLHNRLRVFFETPDAEGRLNYRNYDTLSAGDIIHRGLDETERSSIHSVFKNTLEGMKNTEQIAYCGGDSCDDDTQAYVQGSRLVFCPRFFDSTGSKQAGIAFHEASHLWAGTNDWGVYATCTIEWLPSID